jgi:hypothetical protein
MAREIGKDELWSAVEREHARAKSNDRSPGAVDDGTSANGQASPDAPPAPVIEASAPAAQADGVAQPPPVPVDLEAGEPGEDDDAAIARLAAMRPIEYDRVRR